jgi:hypothetical protein
MTGEVGKPGVADVTMCSGCGSPIMSQPTGPYLLATRDHNLDRVPCGGVDTRRHQPVLPCPDSPPGVT